MKNRKIGSHEMNKDSSRSHSILTIYLISQIVKYFKKKNGDSIIKKYGKLTFVDLAGSERLKESKAKGDMVKETGNINKSLFILERKVSSIQPKSEFDMVGTNLVDKGRHQLYILYPVFQRTRKYFLIFK